MVPCSNLTAAPPPPSKDALRVFKNSEYAAKLREATKTEKRPDGVECSMWLLTKHKCACIKKRKSSECDCKICTLADVLLRRWHSCRHGWRHSWRKAADGSYYRPPPCNCHICSDPERASNYLKVTAPQTCALIGPRCQQYCPHLMSAPYSPPI